MRRVKRRDERQSKKTRGRPLAPGMRPGGHDRKRAVSRSRRGLGGRKIRRDSRSKRRTCKDRHHIGCFFSPALQYDIRYPHSRTVCGSSSLPSVYVWETGKDRRDQSSTIHSRKDRLTKHPYPLVYIAKLCEELGHRCWSTRKLALHTRENIRRITNGRWRTLKAHQRQPLPP